MTEAMDKRLLQLFEMLKERFESSGHPLCPCCDFELDHESDCLFYDLLQNPPDNGKVDAP